jgi:alkanesulfonate monooxygenase SsuD/methylene tetrahydromethanopterin reductase-like flavin-dependent oxidoreductase (luciferase family)
VSPDEFATKRSAVLSAAPLPDRFQTSVNLALIPAGEDRLAHLRERFGPAADMISAGVLTGSADAVTDAIGRYLDAGADWIVLAARAPFDVESIQTFAAEVIPRFRRASPR